MSDVTKAFEEYYETYNDNYDGMFIKSQDLSGQHTYHYELVEQPFRNFKAGYESKAPTPPCNCDASEVLERITKLFLGYRDDKTPHMVFVFNDILTEVNVYNELERIKKEA